MMESREPTATALSKLRYKLLGKDLHPRVRVPIRNRTARIVLNNVALSFWTAAARRNAAFGTVFAAEGVAVPDVGTATGPTPSASVDELIRDAQKFGVAIIEDFLPESQFTLVRDEFDTLGEADSIPFGTGAKCHIRPASAEFRTLFDDVIQQITRSVYGHGYESPKDTSTALQRVELTGVDANDSNTVGHIDRFLPCIKVFYYPHAIPDADQSPYAFVPGSHVVTRQYLANVREAFSTLEYNVNPFPIRNPTTNPEWPVLTKGNSLVLTYTNGLHRRTPFGPTARPGSFRESACFMFYDDYSRWDLLSNFARF